VASGHYLHSHDIKYGSGSGGQSVTGFNIEDEFNSLWVLKEGHGMAAKATLEKLKCGDVVRLEHAETKRNLHASDEKAGISGKWEISCFGENGEGDAYDSWKLECDGWRSNGDVILGNEGFNLRNVKKDTFLYSHVNHRYNQRNCGYNCPIMGSLEISAEDDMSYFTKWRVNSVIVLHTFF
jgi:dolichyl-phosphate-mannose--protein O-mannosyl transferase